MPITREQAMGAKGKYGTASQARNGHPPYWYGKVIDVHAPGDYILFQAGGRRPQWYHRRDIDLHPEPVPPQVPSTGSTGP